MIDEALPPAKWSIHVSGPAPCNIGGILAAAHAQKMPILRQKQLL